MQQTTLKALDEAIAQHNRLLALATNTEQAAALRAQQRALFKRHDELVSRRFSAAEDDWIQAIHALKSFSESADKARQDLDHLGHSIRKATAVIDKLVGLGDVLV